MFPSKEDFPLLLQVFDEAIARRRDPADREKLREILGKLKGATEGYGFMETLLQEIRKIEGKIDQILAPARVPALVLKLPEHLRLTMMAVLDMGESNATQVAERTGRARATESAALNMLVRMGYLKKRRVDRTAYFSPK